MEATTNQTPELGFPFEASGAGGHSIRTGSDQPWDPEDLTIARGQDPTPRNVERSRRELAEWGAAAIEKVVP